MANDLGKPPFQRRIRNYSLLKIVMVAFAVLLALPFFLLGEYG